MKETERNPSRWQLVRDVLLVIVAVFMLLHETIFTDQPRDLILGAALVILGLPGALRLDELRRK